MRPRRRSSAADIGEVRARRCGLTKRGEGARRLRWCGRGTVKLVRWRLHDVGELGAVNGAGGAAVLLLCLLRVSAEAKEK